MPQLDGWEHAHVVDSGTTAYTISSSGKDGAPSGYVVGDDAVQPDICFSHETFIQYPVGAQN